MDMFFSLPKFDLISDRCVDKYFARLNPNSSIKSQDFIIYDYCNFTATDPNEGKVAKAEFGFFIRAFDIVVVIATFIFLEVIYQRANEFADEFDL
jgi:hypothetical protein